MVLILDNHPALFDVRRILRDIAGFYRYVAHA